LIDGLSAEAFLADRGYDSNEIIDKALQSGRQPVIPPKKNRKKQRAYDKAPYCARHLVENAFLHLKRWRGIATRYAKRSFSLPCRCANQAHFIVGGNNLMTLSKAIATLFKFAGIILL
jgi:transposase